MSPQLSDEWKVETIAVWIINAGSRTSHSKVPTNPISINYFRQQQIIRKAGNMDDQYCDEEW
jgi:hypothetical protein